MYKNLGGPALGLTGNIASGKSSVARRLAAHGALVIDADIVAHEAMAPSLPAWQAVVDAFGTGILTADGTIDRSRLRSIVFADHLALQRLNAAVHPHVHAELLRRLALPRREPVAVVEAVALVEADTYRHLDALWLVLSPPEQQIARLVQWRGLSQEDAAWRVAGQPPAETKEPLADTVIRNAGSMEDLYVTIDRAWEQTLAGWGMPKQREESAG